VHAAACLADQPEALSQEAEATGRPSDEVQQRAMWGAKLLADEAAVTNARAAIQVHGGMGFTWEEPLHLYLKRALVHASTFGRSGHLSAALGSQL
jgi:alkylation response protein AidB-like acyl-CoA dehydrogenase